MQISVWKIVLCLLSTAVLGGCATGGYYAHRNDRQYGPPGYSQPPAGQYPGQYSDGYNNPPPPQGP